MCAPRRRASMGTLYEVLGVAREADSAAIKKAYIKKARETHPDKCPGDETAHERFQAVGRAYVTLRDPERRKLYDATGMVDDGAPAQANTSWEEFWRDFYSRVTSERLDALAADYRGSTEEEDNLAAAYTAAKGDMGKVLDNMMLCTAEDEPRFRQMLQVGLV